MNLAADVISKDVGKSEARAIRTNLDVARRVRRSLLKRAGERCPKSFRWKGQSKRSRSRSKAARSYRTLAVLPPSHGRLLGDLRAPFGRMLATRAGPPFFPIAEAARLMPRSSGMRSRSETSPVRISTMCLASWFVPLGRFGCLALRELLHACGGRSTIVKPRIFQTDPLPA